MVAFALCCYQYLSNAVFHKSVCFHSQDMGNPSVTQKLETGAKRVREVAAVSRETREETGRPERFVWSQQTSTVEAKTHSKTQRHWDGRRRRGVQKQAEGRGRHYHTFSIQLAEQLTGELSNRKPSSQCLSLSHPRKGKKERGKIFALWEESLPGPFFCH